MKPVKRYRMVKAPGHPMASKTGLTLLHRKVLFDKIGPERHPCHWCGEWVEWIAGRLRKGALVVDHLDHDKDNNSPENLVPSCNACNAHRLRGEAWDAWTPGSPVGRPDRNHASCPKGHPLYGKSAMSCLYSVESHREAAELRGWLVRQGNDPAAIVLWLTDRRVFLSNDGGYVEALSDYQDQHEGADSA